MSIPMTRGLKLPMPVTSLMFQYHPGVAASVPERDYLEASNSPRKFKVLHNLRTRHADRLYWRFITHTSKDKLPLAVMRNQLRRRWSEAFRIALLENGFDYHGRRLPAALGMHKTKGLKGTLDILVQNARGWDQSVEKLAGDADTIVKGLMRLQSR